MGTTVRLGLVLVKTVLFKVAVSSIEVDPGDTIFVIGADLPAVPLVAPKFALNTKRQLAETLGSVTIVSYTNFFIPGIAKVGSVHCVWAIEAGHTGVISTPAEGGRTPSGVELHNVAPL